MTKTIQKKIIAIIIAFSLFVNSGLSFAAVSFAQEVSPTPVDESAISGEGPSPTPVDSGTPTPTPTMTPDQYDLWKEEQKAIDAQEEVEDDLREQRENEWEAHEEDQIWKDAHGGDYEYYVSGQWERDRETQAAEDTQNESSNEFSEEPSFENTPDGESSPKSCEESPTEEDPQLSLSEGSDSNTASEDNDTTNVSNNNCASIENDITAAGDTGFNEQSGNDGNTNMETGDAGAEGRLVNHGNENVTGTDKDAGENSIQTENINTDDDSENMSHTSESDTLNVDDRNDAYVDNEMNVEATSGSNIITNNDGDATLSTGDIDLIANMLNILNLNITGEDFLHLIVNIFGQLNGTLDLDDIAVYLGYSDDKELEVIARNENTEDDSQNETVVDKEENTNINNSNNAEVENEMNVSGVSGRNEVSENDGSADVVTGRIRILANLMNFINANFSGEKWKFIMINIFGSLTGDIIVPGTQEYLADGNSPDGGVTAQNVDPGEGSINNESAESIETTSVTNTNNIELENNINAAGVSGNNEQTGNDDGDGSHTMNTGKVDVATKLANFLNFNITGNNWVFLIVNVFGKWMGKIVGFAGNADINAPSEGTFAALSVGQNSGEDKVSAQNNNTGEESVNNASSSSVTNTNIDNNNSAYVTNNMNIEGISGQNSVNGNDSRTSLTTGWVDIDANLLNIINMNITGRSWLVVFLNVFGDFLGNLFFGNTPAIVSLPEEEVADEGTDNSEPALGGGPSQNSSNSSNTTGTNSTGVSSNTSTNQSLGSGDTDSKIVLEHFSNELNGNILVSDSVLSLSTESSTSPNSTLSERNWGEILIDFFISLKETLFEKIYYVKRIISDWFAHIKEYFSPVFARFQAPDELISSGDNLNF